MLVCCLVFGCRWVACGYCLVGFVLLVFGGFGLVWICNSGVLLDLVCFGSLCCLFGFAVSCLYLRIVAVCCLGVYVLLVCCFWLGC